MAYKAMWRLAATVWRFGTWWFFCWRGSWTACRSALCGNGVDGHHYWLPCGLSQILGFGGFFSKQKEKNLGEQKFACLLASNFRGRPQLRLFYESKTCFLISWFKFCAKLLWMWWIHVKLPSLSSPLIEILSYINCKEFAIEQSLCFLPVNNVSSRKISGKRCYFH